MPLLSTAEARLDNLFVKGTTTAFGPFATANSLTAGNGINVRNNALFEDEVRIKRQLTLDYDLRCAATIYTDGNLTSFRDVTLGHRLMLSNIPYNPPVSGPDAAVIYLDSASGKLKVSEHGGAFVDLVHNAPFKTYTATTSGSAWENVLSLTFAPGDMKILRFQMTGKRTDDPTDKETFALLEFIAGFYLPDESATVTQIGTQKIFSFYQTKEWIGTTQPFEVNPVFSGATWTLQTRSISDAQTMAWTIKVYE